MAVGILTVDIRIPGALSLKDKRRVLKSLKERLRSRFNISISEVGFQEKWQRSELLAANANIDRRSAEGQLARVLDFIYEFNGVQVCDSAIEFV